MSQSITILFFGDIVARPGRRALQRALPELRERYGAKFVVANSENAAGGIGLDKKTASEIQSAGVEILTLGDHAWQKREAQEILNSGTDCWCVRPANYPEGAPGQGWAIHEDNNCQIGVFSLLGRVFMNIALDCPFRKADELLKGVLRECDIVVCDMHAEASSEKIAMGKYLDGRVSLVVGTHTHIQTADEAILPGGTGYLSDAGMCGVTSGVIGMDAEVALTRFLTGVPKAYKAAKDSEVLLCGCACTIDRTSGKALSIERIRETVRLS